MSATAPNRPSESARETVLVTGAAGTVGTYVVRELIARGKRVIATDRPGCRFEFGLPPASPVEVRPGDLTDLAFCVDVLAGADAVIHLAATIDLALPEAEIRRINVDAVRYLYEAARARGARRFVHFSSGSIYKKSRGALDESTPFAPSSPYEQSKVDAEKYLWDRPRNGTPVTILRPTMIYGPRARFLAAKMAVIPPILGLVFGAIPRVTGGAICNWAHAEDVARAAAFLLDETRASWQAYNVADDTPMAFGEVLEAITTAYGLPLGASVPFPSRVLRLLGPLLAESELFLRAASLASERIWRAVVERHDLVPAIAPSVDRETFVYATIEAVFDTTKLKALGWTPKWKSLREGYKDVLQWSQDNRWMPTYQGSADREWGGAVGLQFDETMAGTWRREGESDDLPFRFSVRASASSARKFARDGLLRLDGRMYADGLSTAKACAGTLDISWRRKRELAYDLRFEGDDGRAYRFAGKKVVSVLRLLDSMTRLPGKIFDEAGIEVGRALARFDLRRDLLAFVGSFRAGAQRDPMAARAALTAKSAREAVTT